MKLIALLAAALMVLPAPQARKAKKPAKPPVTPPAVQQQVVSVETENTSLVFLVNGKGQVYTRHYGARIAEPAQYLEEAAELYTRALIISGGAEPEHFTEKELSAWKYPEDLRKKGE